MNKTNTSFVPLFTQFLNRWLSWGLGKTSTNVRTDYRIYITFKMCLFRQPPTVHRSMSAWIPPQNNGEQVFAGKEGVETSRYYQSLILLQNMPSAPNMMSSKGLLLSTFTVKHTVPHDLRYNMQVKHMMEVVWAILELLSMFDGRCLQAGLVTKV